MNQQFDVLIIGGGVVGLTAALAMAALEYSVALLDAGPLDSVDTSKPDVRVYAINNASHSLLLQLGVWQHIDLKRISPYSQMHVWDAPSGAHIDFDSRYIASQSLGTIIEESVLKQALLQQIVAQPAIKLFSNCTVDDVYSDDQSVRIFSQTNVWEGQLLMIADGACSPTRQKLKTELISWSYHQQAVVATVNTEMPHQHTAWQVFNPDGPLAFLPLSHEHQCSIVWSTTIENAQRLMKLGEKQFNADLTDSFAGRLGQVTLDSTRHQFPLHMRHVKQYTGTRWMLLGDSAHTIHPLAGLGLNIGFADVQAWLNCLNPQRLGSKKALGAYQRNRKHAVWQIILLMEGFKRLFGYSFAPVVSLRGLGLQACNQLIPVKRLFIQHAAG